MGKSGGKESSKPPFSKNGKGDFPNFIGIK